LSGIDHKHFPGPEHDFEPEPGLPERLPETEQLLWQGQPDTAAVARSVFHIRAVAAYFLALLVWKLVADWHDGASLGSAAWETLKVAPLPMAGLGLLYGLAHLTARSTLYTITSKRVVLRIGIVLSVTFNLPFSRIAAADLRRDGSGHGDVSLRLAEGERIAFAHLWPHVRPWRFAQPQPTLRGLADAASVAKVLAQAWSSARQQPASAIVDRASVFDPLVSPVRGVSVQ
jgi:hypothetical protein